MAKVFNILFTLKTFTIKKLKAYIKLLLMNSSTVFITHLISNCSY